MKSSSPERVSGLVPPFTVAEELAAIKKMKYGKAAGPDNIPAEAWKLMDGGVLKC